MVYIADFGSDSFDQNTGLSVFNDLNTIESNITSINAELDLINANIIINQGNIASNVLFLNGSRIMTGNLDMGKKLLIMAGAVGLLAVGNGWLSADSFTTWFTNAWVAVFKNEVFIYITGSSVLGFLLYSLTSQN